MIAGSLQTARWHTWANRLGLGLHGLADTKSCTSLRAAEEVFNCAISRRAATISFLFLTPHYHPRTTQWFAAHRHRFGACPQFGWPSLCPRLFARYIKHLPTTNRSSPSGFQSASERHARGNRIDSAELSNTLLFIRIEREGYTSPHL
jgi:hypothetical protein